MKITKFVHSCVLVEHDGKAVLFDPGIFSWNSGTVDLKEFPEIDQVVVSHKHPDHCAEPFVRELVIAFPDAQWFAPDDTHEDLKTWGVTSVSNQSLGQIETNDGDHAHVAPLGQQVHNLVSHWSNIVTHPGDTHEIIETKDVLLLPLQAPWALTLRAAELITELRPKYVLPIHDWMWNDQWRQTMYDRFQNVCDEAQVIFLKPTDGISIEIDL